MAPPATAAAAAAPPPPPPQPLAQAPPQWSPTQPIRCSRRRARLPEPLVRLARRRRLVDDLRRDRRSSSAITIRTSAASRCRTRRSSSTARVDPYFKARRQHRLQARRGQRDRRSSSRRPTASRPRCPGTCRGRSASILSEFGRINQQHPHAWDFVDQPLVIGHMFGPEGLRNPGARLSWLVPTPFYSELFGTRAEQPGRDRVQLPERGGSLFGRARRSSARCGTSATCSTSRATSRPST